jgi:hypothetical protein
MGRTVTVDLYKDLAAKGKTQVEVSPFSFSIPSAVTGWKNQRLFKVTLPDGASGLRTHNGETSGSIDPTFGGTQVIGSASVIVTAGAPVGTYDLSCFAYWNYWPTLGSASPVTGSKTDKGTIVVVDSTPTQEDKEASLRVNCSPSDVPDPQWTYDAWGHALASGSSAQLQAGTYTIKFKSSAPKVWTPPDDTSVTLSAGDEATLSATYAKVGSPTTETGTLRVILKPSTLASARWSEDDWTHSRSSGASVKLTAGGYTVEFQCADSTYEAPGSQYVYVAAGETATLTAEFTAAGTEEPETETVWKVRTETTVTRSFAGADGYARMSVETCTDADGAVASTTRTMSGEYVTDLLETPTILLPIESKTCHKTVISQDVAAIARLGLRQKDLTIVGIHEDAQHDRISDYLLARLAQCVKATLVVPLNPAIRPGDRVTYDHKTYDVSAVTHTLDDRTSSLSLVRAPSYLEVREAIRGEETDEGSAVIAAIRAAGKRLDNVRIGTVVSRIDYRTYDVRLHGQAETLRAIADLGLVADSLVGALVLVARKTEVF